MTSPLDPRVLRSLNRVRDPRRRVARAREVIDQVRSIEAAVVAIRDDALRTLHREGLGYGEIAKIAGITRARVAQIANAVAEGDRADE